MGKYSKTNWHKGILSVEDGDTLYLSVVFTWDLPKARRIALHNPHKRVVAGGPATVLMPEYLSDCAEIQETYHSMVQLHNADACRTSKGCDRGCKFCAVKMVEGNFTELPTDNIKPIICDSNFLQSSNKHFNTVIDKCKALPYVDFNQGLDARLLTNDIAGRLSEVNIPTLRFAWDSAGCEAPVMKAIETVEKAGFKRSHITVYCLVNHGEEPEEALYRLQTLKEAGVVGFPMRFQPLTTTEKNEHVDPKWDTDELKRFVRYWSRQNWLCKIPYAEFSNHGMSNQQEQCKLF